MPYPRTPTRSKRSFWILHQRNINRMLCSAAAMLAICTIMKFFQRALGECPKLKHPSDRSLDDVRNQTPRPMTRRSGGLTSDLSEPFLTGGANQSPGSDSTLSFPGSVECECSLRLKPLRDISLSQSPATPRAVLWFCDFDNHDVAIERNPTRPACSGPPWAKSERAIVVEPSP
jgi:hypothetical protein